MLALIRGAGDLATGIAVRLYRSGIRVVMTDLPYPLCIRRTVSFSEAIRCGEAIVEDVRARKVDSSDEIGAVIDSGAIPVLPDADALCRHKLKPDVMIDAILAKKNLGTRIDDAPIVIGVGPGFTAPHDCHAVIETMRGHTLGRAIYQGCALPNTNVPGLIGGFAGERVLRAPADGVFQAVAQIGQTVKEGEVVGYVGDAPMICTIGGVLRGLLADGLFVTKGLKSGDVDPRGVADYCWSISDKANAVAGGVLEAILHCSGALYTTL